MITHFNPKGGLIVVRGELTGPAATGVLQLAVDTGATLSLINFAMLVRTGYDPAVAKDRIQITTGSGVEFVPQVAVSRFAALGIERIDFPILAHTLPPSAGVDGLLGLDFFRAHKLQIDFRNGTVDVG